MKFNAERFREGLNKKHQALELEIGDEVIVLRHAMRMPATDRQCLDKHFKDWREKFPPKPKDGEDDPDRPQPEEAEIRKHLAGIITLLVGDKQKATLLLNSDLAGDGVPLKEDLGSMDYLLDLHSGGGEDLGEASPSQD